MRSFLDVYTVNISLGLNVYIVNIDELKLKLNSVKKMTHRETYHHKELRQALIDAALELIVEKDVGSLSLREVARRVGVSHAAPYRHFADKDALLAAVAEEGFELLSITLKEAMQQASSDPLKQVQACGVAYVRYALAHPSHYRIMFGAYGATAQHYPTLADAAMQAFMVLVNSIIAGQKAGMIRSEDPKQLATAAWSLVHGLAMLIIDGQIPIKESQAVASLSSFITQTLIEGLTG